MVLGNTCSVEGARFCDFSGDGVDFVAGDTSKDVPDRLGEGGLAPHSVQLWFCVGTPERQALL